MRRCEPEERQHSAGGGSVPAVIPYELQTGADRGSCLFDGCDQRFVSDNPSSFEKLYTLVLGSDTVDELAQEDYYGYRARISAYRGWSTPAMRGGFRRLRHIR